MIFPYLRGMPLKYGSKRHSIFNKKLLSTAAKLSNNWGPPLHMADFANANTYGVAGFDLTLEKKTINDQEQWWGTFTADGKTLKIIATLEK